MRRQSILAAATVPARRRSYPDSAALHLRSLARCAAQCHSRVASQRPQAFAAPSNPVCLAIGQASVLVWIRPRSAPVFMPQKYGTTCVGMPQKKQPSYQVRASHGADCADSRSVFRGGDFEKNVAGGGPTFFVGFLRRVRYPWPARH